MKKVKAIICLLLTVLTLSSCGSLQDEITTDAETEECYSYEASEAASTQSETAFEQTTVAETTSENKSVHTTTAVSTTEVTTAISTTIVTTTEITTKKADTCFVTIVCGTINDNIDNLKSSKKAFVPSDGIILSDVPVEVKDGDTAFDIIKRACSENTCKANCKYCQQSGIQIEYTYTPAFDNYYIEGIHQIYEKDCGMQSGWMYSVNGVFPNVGASSYSIKAGDKIVFAYTCDMGEDVGNSY